jgi:hypothetical protein
MRRWSRGRTALLVFVAGSAVTLAVVFLLLRRRHPAAALTVLEVSPFPCPPGLPC